MFSSRRLPRVCLKSFAKRTRVWTRPRRPGTTHGLPRAPGPRLAGLQGGQPGVQGSEGQALPGPAWRLPRECTPLQSPCDGAEVWPLHAGGGRAGTLDGVSASSRAAARRRAPRGTDRRLPQGPAAAGAARPELVRPRPDRSVCDSRGGKCGGRRDRVPLGRPETLPGRATHGEACRLGGRWQSKESGEQLLQGGAGVAKRRGPDRFPRPRGEIRPASSPLSAFSFLPHRNPPKGVRRARDKAELSPAPPFPSKYAHGAARGPGPQARAASGRRNRSRKPSGESNSGPGSRSLKSRRPHSSWKLPNTCRYLRKTRISCKSVETAPTFTY